MRILLIIAVIIIPDGCVTYRNIYPTEFRKGILRVDFCDLPQHVGELVYIECTYSGVEEYWSIWGRKKCRPQLKTELEFLELSNDVTKQCADKFQQVHSNYFDLYLTLKLIGRFYNTESGVGHLGSNNSKFTVEEVVEIDVMAKTKSI
ncbi:MAG: hypothetical protein U5K79_19405 [Cyclobacteriaceae bacterium]|nr:hypothetical protein [Cyclobacteriaceae bacterium]